MLVSFFHAASEKPSTRASRSGILSALLRVVIGGDAVICAMFHSGALSIVLETVSSGEIILFSNINLFLAVQIYQQIYGKRSDRTPNGGRQIEVLHFLIASEKALIPVRIEGTKGDENREEFHTFLA